MICKTCNESFIRSTSETSATAPLASSVRSSVHPFLRPFDRPSVKPFVRSIIRPSVLPFFRSSVRPSNRPTVLSSVCPSVRSFVRPSVRRPSVCQSVCLSIRPYCHTSIRPSVLPSVHPSFRPSLRQTIGLFVIGSSHQCSKLQFHRFDNKSASLRRFFGIISDTIPCVVSPQTKLDPSRIRFQPHRARMISRSAVRLPFVSLPSRLPTKPLTHHYAGGACNLIQSVVIALAASL